MPCFYPLQAFSSPRGDGKLSVRFSNFRVSVDSSDRSLQIPCGRCMGCRLERSRQWAVRIMHEASLYEDNCFITLTFADVHLINMCPNGSLVKSHVQNFMKRLRQKFSGRCIRFFACGEYGEKFERPHYHICLFNLDFKDKLIWRVRDEFRYYVSDTLSALWPYGHSEFSDLTFDSAAYVARYCTKKVNGSAAEDHYCGRLPEFALMSRRPGLGAPWIEKYGRTDCFNHDELIVRGVRCKSPRFYDTLFEKDSPGEFLVVKADRALNALSKASDNTSERLLVKEKCCKARFRKLVRTYEGV